MDPLIYSDEEYNLYCKGTEKDTEEGYEPWTRGETDVLLDLCKVYELRWPVIYDRYHELLEDGVHKLRTMEELQYRYYTIATALTRAKVDRAIQEEIDAMAKNDSSNNNITATTSTMTNTTATPSSSASPGGTTAPVTTTPSQQQKHIVKQAMKHRIVSHTGTGASTREFTFQQERMRRYQLELSWNRSRKEEEEEMKLREELKLIEGQLRRLKKSGKHILAAHDAAAAVNNNTTTMVAVGEGPEVVASTLIETAGISFDSVLASSSVGKRGVPYMQSSRLGLPTPAPGGALNKTLLKKLELTLHELKIPLRPIATKRVCDASDIATKSILTLLTLQKIATQKEKDVTLKQQRLVKAQNAATVAKARAAAATAARDNPALTTMPPSSLPSSSSSATAATGGGGATPTGGAPILGGTTGPKLTPTPAVPGALVTSSLAGPNAVPARTLPMIGASIEGSASKQVSAPPSIVNAPAAAVEGNLPTNMSFSANLVTKVEGKAEEAVPMPSTTVVSIGLNQLNTVGIPAKATGKSKKKATAISAAVEALAKRSAPQKEPVGGGGKGKKRKSNSTPKLDSESPLESFKLPVTSTLSTSVAPSAGKAVLPAMDRATIATPTSTMPQATVAWAAGIPTASHFTPLIPVVAPPARPTALSSGSEEAKNVKKRAKKS